MSGFQVNPAALDHFARRLGEQDPAATCLGQQYEQRANVYVNTYVTLPAGAGGEAFEQIVGRTATLAAGIEKGNYRVGSAMMQSAVNLAASAVEYRETDTRSAAKLDQAYHPTGIVPLIEDPPVGDPWTDPSDTLVEPSSDGPDGPVPDNLVTDIVNSASNWTDVGWLGEKILELFGLNPEEWLTEKLAGNFAQVARARNAVANLAAFDRAARDDLEAGLGDLVAAWKGNAATAAQSYFTELFEALHARADVLDNVVASYDTVLSIITLARNAIASVVEQIIGKVIEICAAVAAAGCLAEIPTVDLIIGIVGASKVGELIHLIHSLWDLWTSVWGQITGWAGAFDTVSNATSTWTLGVRMPARPYHNASQDRPHDRQPAHSGAGDRR